MASITYDGLIVVAIWMLGTVLVVPVLGRAVEPASPMYQLFLWLLAWPYFAICWIRGGQTLGMRAWKIYLEAVPGPMGWPGSFLRYVVAWVSALALGAGFLWSLARSDRATWHDLASRTRLVVRVGDDRPQNRRRSK